MTNLIQQNDTSISQQLNDLFTQFIWDDTIFDFIPNENTRTAYSTAILRFRSWLGNSAFTRQAVQNHLDWMAELDYAYNSIDQARSALMWVVSQIIQQAEDEVAETAAMWLMRGEIVNKANSFSRVTVNAPRGKKLGRWLSFDEAKNLLAGIRLGKNYNRDKAIIMLLLGAGLRRSEVISLKKSDIRTIAGRVVIDVLGKGDKIRTIPLNQQVATVLQAYARIAQDKLFDMSDENITRIVASSASRAKLGDVKPHDLRRTFARLLYEQGANIFEVSNLLGHSSVEITKIYIGANTDLANSSVDKLNF